MKSAIVTGASRGIGFQVAKTLKENGYQVLTLARSVVDLPGVDFIRGDLAGLVRESSNEMADNIKNEIMAWVDDHQNGTLSIIHNASILRKDSVENLGNDDFLKVLELNVLVPQKLNQLILPYMKEGSSIIYIGSTLSEKAVKNSFSYVTSKHALAGMMRATCQDLAGKGIHTSLICPGFTHTEMLWEHVGKDENVLEFLKNKMTFGRLISPDEMAKLIHFAVENPLSNGSIWHAHLGQIES